MCNDVCIDPSSDPENCGTCDNICSAGDICISGSCVTPPQNCGNGQIDAGEECDDGNLTDGDGCSSSCQIEGSDCTNPTIFGPGDTGSISGTTSNAGNDFTPSCVGSSAADDVVVEWTPLSDGSYTINTFGSTFDTVLSILDDCSDLAIELACNDDAQGTQSQIIVDASAGIPLFIVVDGFATQSGNFTLNITFGGAGVCGDGVIDGEEECDDGNNTSGDSCHSDVDASCEGTTKIICTTIEVITI